MLLKILIVFLISISPSLQEEYCGSCDAFINLSVQSAEISNKCYKKVDEFWIPFNKTSRRRRRHEHSALGAIRKPWIIKATFEAKRIYETIFQETYNARMLIQRMPYQNMLSPIQSIFSGSFFKEKIEKLLQSDPTTWPEILHSHYHLLTLGGILEEVWTQSIWQTGMKIFIRNNPDFLVTAQEVELALEEFHRRALNAFQNINSMGLDGILKTLKGTTLAEYNTPTCISSLDELFNSTDNRLIKCNFTLCEIATEKGVIYAKNQVAGDISLHETQTESPIYRDDLDCTALVDTDTATNIRQGVLERCAHIYDHKSGDYGEIIINEFAMFRKNEFKEFVELKYISRVNQRVRSKIASLRNTKFIVIDYIKQECFSVCKLHNHNFNENNLFVIDNELVKTNKWISKTKSKTFRFLPTANSQKTGTYVLAVLKQKNSMNADDWNKIDLVGRKGILKMTPEIWTLVSETVLDLAVYGTATNTDLSHLKTVCNKFKGCNFVLPIPRPTKKNPFVSVGYCPPPGNSIRPFEYYFFKHGKATPLSQNDCTTEAYPLSSFEHEPSENPEVFTQEGLVSNIEYSSQCPMVGDKKAEEIISSINTALRAYKSIDANFKLDFYPNFNYLNEATAFFGFTNFHLHAIGSTLGPFKIIRHGTSQTINAVVCYVCRERIENAKHTIHGKYVDAFMSEKGLFIANTKELMRRVKEHTYKHEHLNSILSYVETRYRNVLINSGSTVIPSDIIPRVESEDFLQTQHHILSAISLIKMNTAPENFPTLIDTISACNGDVGVHMNSPETAMNIISFVSKEFKSSIISYMLTNKVEFSLILDATSDITGNHPVLFYFQTLEGNRVMTYLWASRVLDGRQGALDYCKLVLDLAKSEGSEFFEYFKENIVALITDSENTMKSFHRIFENEIGRTGTLVNVFCLAHKLQLATRSAMVPLKTDDDLGRDNCFTSLEVMETLLESFYTYLTRSGIRLNLFRSVVDNLNLPKIELVRLHIARWISSEFRVISNFILAIPGVHETLSILSTSHEYLLSVRAEAERHLHLLLDKDFILTVHFMKDYCKCFKYFSEAIQKEGILMVDMQPYVDNLMVCLERVGEMEGEELLDFLSSVELSIEQYLVAEEVEATFGGINLKFASLPVNQKTFHPLNILAPELVRKTLARMNVYLDFPTMNRLKFLNPNLMPGSYEVYQNDMETYGEEEITFQCRLFRCEPSQVIKEWKLLIQSLFKSKEFGYYRNVRPSAAFWEVVFEDETITIGNEVRSFIRKALTIAPGSTIPESGFSKYAVIKNKLRSSLNDVNVEHLLRLSIHLPKNIKDFDSARYARKWLASGHLSPPQQLALNLNEEVEGGTDNFERFSDVVGTCNLFVREVDEWGQYSCPDQTFEEEFIFKRTYSSQSSLI